VPQALIRFVKAKMAKSNLPFFRHYQKTTATLQLFYDSPWAVGYSPPVMSRWQQTGAVVVRFGGKTSPESRIFE